MLDIYVQNYLWCIYEYEYIYIYVHIRDEYTFVSCFAVHTYGTAYRKWEFGFNWMKPSSHSMAGSYMARPAAWPDLLQHRTYHNRNSNSNSNRKIYICLSAGPSLEGATRLRSGSAVKSSTVTFLRLKSSSSELKVY